MKKYQFLIYHRDYHDFLDRLRELGVVHVVQKQNGVLLENENLAKIIEVEKRYAEVIKRLNRINEDEKVKETAQIDASEKGNDLLVQVETLFNEKDALLLEKQLIEKEIERILPLDDFDPTTLERFHKRNWFIHFHSTSLSKFDQQWLEDYNAVIFKTIGTQLYFATFTNESSTPPIEAEHIHIPEKSGKVLEEELTVVKKRIEEAEMEIKTIARNAIQTLRHQHTILSDEVTFEKVQLSADNAAGERLMILEGYVPVRDEEATNARLEKEAIYYSSENPTPQDNTPIKYKNNKFARAFEMISDLYDRPNYNAYDLTPFYAPFYIVFFGLCLGDAGYGLLIFIASFFLKKKASSDFMRSAGQLATYLGLGTMIFGFISGTFFGMTLSEETWTWIQPLKRFILDSNQLFYLALALGAVQITYALIIKGVTTWMRYGFLYSLDTFGWLIMIWGNAIPFALAGGDTITPDLQITLHIVFSSLGGAMMLLFNSPEKGLKGVPLSIGSGLYGVFNKVTGLLGDLLSYIRLFALGISGSVLGSVFNFLAISFAPDIIILRELVIIAILLFGHGINLFINGLGAFIHPLRLTFVEFYNNAGFDGGGKAYTPFKKQSMEIQ
ncbi:hypothetical protein LJC68_08900 [Bacteroidales bacterium OttesenSCG-928-B11]|nr:hypothetical protein [Bacteroidales bacterium OttesenSCG-928-E04]MDL2308183.1 hypothetical protein [Bacteroidales bacterium OttesenSCG-928-C03]MDL2312977.1 hypothetical protein [Bacteroidales bacterium OttesenSCG-928-B11]MDL2325622.1 hypothetical protein [Bacteroidales bacterium OttesenSCG-928-A14]